MKLKTYFLNPSEPYFQINDEHPLQYLEERSWMLKGGILNKVSDIEFNQATLIEEYDVKNDLNNTLQHLYNCSVMSYKRYSNHIKRFIIALLKKMFSNAFEDLDCVLKFEHGKVIVDVFSFKKEYLKDGHLLGSITLRVYPFDIQYLLSEQEESLLSYLYDYISNDKTFLQVDSASFKTFNNLLNACIDYHKKCETLEYRALVKSLMGYYHVSQRINYVFKYLEKLGKEYDTNVSLSDRYTYEHLYRCLEAKKMKDRKPLMESVGDEWISLKYSTKFLNKVKNAKIYLMDENNAWKKHLSNQVAKYKSSSFSIRFKAQEQHIINYFNYLISEENVSD